MKLSELSVNRAAGRGEIEGKAARARGERVGRGASFKSLVQSTDKTTDDPPSLGEVGGDDADPRF